MTYYLIGREGEAAIRAEFFLLYMVILRIAASPSFSLKRGVIPNEVRNRAECELTEGNLQLTYYKANNHYLSKKVIFVYKD
jgi:hypothetical protein